MSRRIYFLTIILTLTLANPNPNPNPIDLTIQLDLIGQSWLLSLDRVVPHIVLRNEQRILKGWKKLCSCTWSHGGFFFGGYFVGGG